MIILIFLLLIKIINLLLGLAWLYYAARRTPHSTSLFIATKFKILLFTNLLINNKKMIAF